MSHWFRTASVKLCGVALLLLLPAIFVYAQGTTSPTTPAKAPAPATPTTSTMTTGVLIPVTTGTTPTAAQSLEVTTATTITVQNLETTTKTTVTVPALGLTTTTTVSAPLAPAVATAATSATTTTVATVLPSAETTGTAPAETEQAKAPYLREIKPIDIFDPDKGEQSATPLQRTAKVLSERQQGHKRISPTQMRNVAIEEFTLVGADPAALHAQAIHDGLLAAAGRLYYGNIFLLGRDLLAPYLDQHARQYVTQANEVKRRYLPENQVAVTYKVSVNMDALYQDLNEMHFIAEPNLRPVVAVFLQEIVNSQPDTSANGRARIERTMEQNLFRVVSDKMGKPPLNADLSGSPDLLKAARLEAQRNNADVLITGTLSVRPLYEKKILFDGYNFQDADVVLKMYRADTGELLAEERDRYSAAAGSGPDSISRVLDSMLTRATQNLADQLMAMWPNTMLDQSPNYRLMITNVKPQQITTVYNFLKALDPDLKIYQKSYYGNVLVLNLKAPNTSEAQLEKFMREISEPTFEVRKAGKRHYVMSVL